MKKLFTLILSLFCVGAAMAAGAAKDTIEVYDADDFIKVIQQDNDANIRLMANIQLGELKSHICDTFTGSIDGCYEKYDEATQTMKSYEHVIYGDPSRQAEWKNTEMFAKVENAEFRNVCFANISVKIFSHSNTGVIAETAINSDFVGVRFKNIKVWGNNDNVGIVAGQADGCFFGALSFEYCDVYADGLNAGGTVGQSIRCNFEFCDTAYSCSVYADGRETSGGAFVGGFSGHSTNDVFKSCVNGAMVGANSNKAGGFTGWSKNSNFFDCQNGGYIVHSRHDLFEESVKDMQDLIDTFTDTELMSTIVGAVGVGVTTLAGAFSPWLISAIKAKFLQASVEAAVEVPSILRPLQETVNLLDPVESIKGIQQYLNYGQEVITFEQEWRYSIYVSTYNSYYNDASYVMRTGNFVGYARAVMIPLAVVMAIEIGATIAWHAYEGDDETGGISSHAVGGVFEQCNNFGNLRCKDDNCGAIVGLGEGVTINNCFNSGSAQWDEKDTSASILGKAEVDESNGNKKCLVTNCLSTWNFHIVGDEKIDAGLDPASGNNYRMSGGEGEDVFCEMQVNQKQLESGLVAVWLNQGIQNRSLGIKPWRQTLVAEVDSLKDKHPVLDLLHSVVTVEELAHDTIRNADELMAFAKRVNEKDQFACAVLDADIDMKDKDWTPIGKAEPGKHFRGIFDGRGHTIDKLKCEGSGAVGLFGAAHTGAQISNVILGDNCQFTSTSEEGAGGILGRVATGWAWTNVVIEGCGNQGNVRARKHAGGILGRVSTNIDDASGAIKIQLYDCYNTGTITAEAGNSGLLCGYLKKSGYVRDSWSAGQLRIADGFTAKPFSNENPNNKEGEFLVGYDVKLDIKNCYIIDPWSRIDSIIGYKRQLGVDSISVAKAESGELAYQLNDSVCDGTQSWYQTIGVDPCPVHTKLPDGTNMVLPYRSLESDAIAGFANTNCEMISDVILGKKKYADCRVTDVDYDAEKPGTVDVVDLTQFIEAVNR